MRVLYTFGYEGLKRNRHAGSKMYAVVVPIVRLWPLENGNHGGIRHARRSASEEANGFCNRGGVPVAGSWPSSHLNWTGYAVPWCCGALQRPWTLSFRHGAVCRWGSGTWSLGARSGLVPCVLFLGERFSLVFTWRIPSDDVVDFRWAFGGFAMRRVCNVSA